MFYKKNIKSIKVLKNTISVFFFTLKFVKIVSTPIIFPWINMDPYLADSEGGAS